MKLLYILMILPFLSCSAQKKLQIETILTQPARVTSQDPETGRVINRSTNIPKTKRTEPAIIMQMQYEDKLTFLIQGNISSGGHTINKVKKIRFEKGKQNGNTITLKYFVEIKRIPGKESANVGGYNYTKEETYIIPEDVKVIHVELYHERLDRSYDQYLKDKENPKLVVQQTFDIKNTIVKNEN
ncbi:hypothetical protein [Sphingobacterium bovistauri]|uniref:Lipoprotein n=1 Tax=Sphingobacterium bovistauri TaxID=2781959 RepID=A0ABS7Z4V9_9SPHI|nr:hypothetical protein [Sphingobacterium bovistauri]MCA5005226.1 hypothetical protein [Sphingobacterium bovistauri]